MRGYSGSSHSKRGAIHSQNAAVSPSIKIVVTRSGRSDARGSVGMGVRISTDAYEPTSLQSLVVIVLGRLGRGVNASAADPPERDLIVGDRVTHELRQRGRLDVEAALVCDPAQRVRQVQCGVEAIVAVALERLHDDGLELGG